MTKSVSKSQKNSTRVSASPNPIKSSPAPTKSNSSQLKPSPAPSKNSRVTKSPTPTRKKIIQKNTSSISLKTKSPVKKSISPNTFFKDNSKTGTPKNTKKLIGKNSQDSSKKSSVSKEGSKRDSARKQKSRKASDLQLDLTVFFQNQTEFRQNQLNIKFQDFIMFTNKNIEKKNVNFNTIFTNVLETQYPKIKPVVPTEPSKKIKVTMYATKGQTKMNPVQESQMKQEFEQIKNQLNELKKVDKQIEPKKSPKKDNLNRKFDLEQIQALKKQFLQKKQ